MPPSFGQVWTTGHPTHAEVLPSVPHLVVSSDLYNESGLGVIVVEIDSHEMRDPELHEPIPGIGTVMLDRLSWYPQNWLREHIGNLPDDRHTELGRLIRNLIGP
ncbi:MAG: type II toxin-antitoxin system PemK/MazF family toxin [Pseudonocardiaceae bacterium]